MATTSIMRSGGILIGLLALGLEVGCGTAANVTAFSLIDDAELRPWAVMGGTQYDTYVLKNHRGQDWSEALLDICFSVLADIALLPITLPVAAIIGDGPFEPKNKPLATPPGTTSSVPALEHSSSAEPSVEPIPDEVTERCPENT